MQLHKWSISQIFLAGLIIGGLSLGTFHAYSAIQQQVGINCRNLAGVWQPTPTADDTASAARTCAQAVIINNPSDSTMGVWNAITQATAATARTPGVGLVAPEGGIGRIVIPAKSTTLAVSNSHLYGTVGVGNYLIDGQTPTVGVLPRTATATHGISGNTVQQTANVSFNGSTYDQDISASAANLSATETNGIGAMVPFSTWNVTHTPAAATQAIASKAAGGGTVRHVATGLIACIAAGATAQTPILVNLRDGATGAGTIKASFAVSTPINSSACPIMPIPTIIGTANTAMTLEFSAAGAAATQQTVTLQGYSVP